MSWFSFLRSRPQTPIDSENDSSRSVTSVDDEGMTIVESVASKACDIAEVRISRLQCRFPKSDFCVQRLDATTIPRLSLQTALRNLSRQVTQSFGRTKEELLESAVRDELDLLSVYVLLLYLGHTFRQPKSNQPIRSPRSGYQTHQ